MCAITFRTALKYSGQKPEKSIGMEAVNNVLFLLFHVPFVYLARGAGVTASLIKCAGGGQLLWVLLPPPFQWTRPAAETARFKRFPPPQNPESGGLSDRKILLISYDFIFIKRKGRFMYLCCRARYYYVLFRCYKYEYRLISPFFSRLNCECAFIDWVDNVISSSEPKKITKIAKPLLNGLFNDDNYRFEPSTYTKWAMSSYIKRDRFNRDYFL